MLGEALADSFSRSRLQALIADGYVISDGATITDASRKVKPGENYYVVAPPLLPAVPQAQPAALDIIYEDAHLLVLNKAAGMTVHPGAGNPDGTLVNALLAHCGDSLSGIGGVARPGIVHRIDKETSGLLVVAKHDAAHRHLSAQLAARTLKRNYLALAWAVPHPWTGIIDAPIGRSPKHRKKMAIVKGGRPARTYYRVKEAFGDAAALLAFSLETGRTHQIRVHALHLGHPLVGDPVYGGAFGSKLARLEKQLEPDDFIFLRQFKRQALHAETLRFIHPMTEQELAFDAPLPADMQALISVFRRLPRTARTL